MGRKISQEALRKHKEESLKTLETYIDSLINDENPKIQSKADKLSFWLEHWTTFLSFESKFRSTSLRRYKRGEIIKVHLGYNIGSEEGGLHYCVVVEKNNSINSRVITVVPLTSVKTATDVEHLKPGCVYLGNELFTSLNSKIITTQKHLSSNIANAQERLEHLKQIAPSDYSSENFSELDSLQKDLANMRRESSLHSRMQAEINKMKKGSIALVGQITTISKIRIYDPKTNYDILSNVKLSNEMLDRIDNEIIKKFTGLKKI